MSHPHASRVAARAVRARFVPMLVLVATSALAATAATPHVQPKPQLSVEATPSAQGARLSFKGKGWTPKGRLKITGTRAPGASGAQDFGMYSTDSTGAVDGRKVVPCSTSNMDDGTEMVTITATDSTTNVKATARVQGGAWVCQ